jgi:hypothetical protein
VGADVYDDLVVRSPCCHRAAYLPAWIVAYARQVNGGRVRIQCGRDATDPLRAAGAVRSRGCGKWYEVDLS